jgi:hypothetical protein
MPIVPRMMANEYIAGGTGLYITHLSLVGARRNFRADFKNYDTIGKTTLGHPNNNFVSSGVDDLLKEFRLRS